MSDVVERVARAIYGEVFDECPDIVKARMIKLAARVIAVVNDAAGDPKKPDDWD